MPLTCGTATIGTAATLLFKATGQPQDIHIKNLDNTDTISLGCESVVAGGGYVIPKEATFDITLRPDSSLYGISTKAGHALGWVKQSY